MDNILSDPRMAGRLCLFLFLTLSTHSFPAHPRYIYHRSVLDKRASGLLELAPSEHVALSTSMSHDIKPVSTLVRPHAEHLSNSLIDHEHTVTKLTNDRVQPADIDDEPYVPELMADHRLARKLVSRWDKLLTQRSEMGLDTYEWEYKEVGAQLGLYGRFRFWDNDAAENLKTLENSVGRIPENWEQFIHPEEPPAPRKKHTTFWHDPTFWQDPAFWEDILQSLALEVPHDQLTRSIKRYEIIMERLRQPAETFWWKRGFSTTLDPVEHCETILEWGDAPAFSGDELPPNHDETIKSLTEIARGYFWREIEEATHRKQISQRDINNPASHPSPTTANGQSFEEDSDFIQPYFRSFEGIRPLQVKRYDQAGQDIIQARINTLLGDAATRTKPIRIQMNHSPDGRTWVTDKLTLEWYLKRLNPHLMYNFGHLIQEAAEKDAKILTSAAHGHTDISGITWRELKTSEKNLQYAAEEILTFADGPLPASEISRMQSWYLEALRMSEPEESSVLITESEPMVQHAIQLPFESASPTAPGIASATLPVSLPELKRATGSFAPEDEEIRSIDPHSASSKSRQRYFPDYSAISKILKIQDKLHWEKIPFDKEIVEQAGEFLALPGHFPPLTTETVERSHLLERKLSQARTNWESLINLFQRWLSPALLKEAYERYLWVIARLRQGLQTYWWQQGKLETSFHPLFELKETLIWGDQLALDRLDIVYANVPDRSQRLAKLLSVAQSYASRTTDSGNLGKRSIYSFTPIRFTFITSSREDIAGERLKTLLRAPEKNLAPTKSDIITKSNGKPWWSHNLALQLQWFMMRFNPEIVGPFGRTLYDTKGSWQSRVKQASADVISTVEAGGPSFEEVSAMRQFYTAAAKGSLPNDHGPIRDRAPISGRDTIAGRIPREKVQNIIEIYHLQLPSGVPANLIRAKRLGYLRGPVSQRVSEALEDVPSTKLPVKNSDDVSAHSLSSDSHDRKPVLLKAEKQASVPTSSGPALNPSFHSDIHDGRPAPLETEKQGSVPLSLKSAVIPSLLSDHEHEVSSLPSSTTNPTLSPDHEERPLLSKPAKLVTGLLETKKMKPEGHVLIDSSKKVINLPATSSLIEKFEGLIKASSGKSSSPSFKIETSNQLRVLSGSLANPVQAKRLGDLRRLVPQKASKALGDVPSTEAPLENPDGVSGLALNSVVSDSHARKPVPLEAEKQASVPTPSGPALNPSFHSGIHDGRAAPLETEKQSRVPLSLGSAVIAGVLSDHEHEVPSFLPSTTYPSASLEHQEQLLSKPAKMVTGPFETEKIKPERHFLIDSSQKTENVPLKNPLIEKSEELIRASPAKSSTPSFKAEKSDPLLSQVDMLKEKTPLSDKITPEPQAEIPPLSALSHDSKTSLKVNLENLDQQEDSPRTPLRLRTKLEYGASRSPSPDRESQQSDVPSWHSSSWDQGSIKSFGSPKYETWSPTRSFTSSPSSSFKKPPKTIVRGWPTATQTILNWLSSAKQWVSRFLHKPIYKANIFGRGHWPINF